MSGEGRAQEDEGGGQAATAGVAASAVDADDGGVQPLALERFAPRPLTAADFPPANPLLANTTYRTSAIFGRDWRAGRAEYRQLVERESLAFGLPPALVDAVMAVESRYNPGVVGMDGEVGLMQVMLPTARMMGFAGTPAELASPEVNVHYGVRYLAGAWRRANGDLCTATMKYRAGHGETRFSYLSVEYCTRVRAHLAASGVAVTGSVPQATFGRSAGGGGPGRGSRVLTAGGAINFAALNTRLRGVAERKAPADLR
ncbi:lytic transglycosylase domain-containing protein [Bradyrhizobium betae]|uniref:Lytic transglycosylase domain-containing protein n=2 Tax=Bradyrhizobium betae TaxID=244734 RepID=A0A5P6PHD1_9BRAD|nr:lytic transglycosylase domain-containing protein [Bradyrhizobium betae]